MRYPRYLIVQYGGLSRKFEAAHRKRLQEARRALRLARYGCAFAPSMTKLGAANAALDAAIEACRVKNWKPKK